MLASLERRPLKYDANECRSKFFIDKVEISVADDYTLDISSPKCVGSFQQRTLTNP